MTCDRCDQERPIVGKITSDVLQGLKVCWPCFEDACKLMIRFNRMARRVKMEIEAIN